MRLDDEAVRLISARILLQVVEDVRRGAVLLRRLHNGEVKQKVVDWMLEHWDIPGAVEFFDAESELWQAIVGAEIVNTQALMGMIGRDLALCREWVERRRRNGQNAALDDTESQNSA